MITQGVVLSQCTCYTHVFCYEVTNCRFLPRASICQCQVNNSFAWCIDRYTHFMPMEHIHVGVSCCFKTRYIWHWWRCFNVSIRYEMNCKCNRSGNDAINTRFMTPNAMAMASGYVAMTTKFILIWWWPTQQYIQWCMLLVFLDGVAETDHLGQHSCQCHGNQQWTRCDGVCKGRRERASIVAEFGCIPVITEAIERQTKVFHATL